MACLFIMIVMVTSFVSAIRINEFEANPSGSDSGNEWVELYSEEEINLESYSLENADGDIYELSGSFSDYFIVHFDSQWLDNVDEKIYLKKEGILIDETGMFDDSKNNGKTWNFCGEEWEFLEDSKGEINSCSEDSEDDESEENSEDDGEKQEENEEETSQEENEEQEKEEVQSKTTGKIILNSRGKDSANKEFVSSEKKVRLGVVYGFLILCVFLIILLALRRL